MLVNLSSALLFATAISALPFGKRDATSVVTNLGTITTQTQALTTSITNWDSTILGALSIPAAVTSLGSAIDAANTAASTEAQLSSADSQTVLTCKQPPPPPPRIHPIRPLDVRTLVGS